MGSNNSGKGVSMAAQMLSGLDPQTQKKVIDLMAKKDPLLTEVIQQKMISIDDLTSMTPTMISDLFKTIPIKKFSIALKLAQKETQDFFLSNVSKGMRDDILDNLNGVKLPKSDVEETHQEVMALVREMVSKGLIILNSSGDEYV